MDEPDENARQEKPDPRGQTEPPGGQDRSHNPANQTTHAASAADQLGPDASEEARNQAATSEKSRAESGTP